MVRLELLRWSRLVCSGALAALVASACGGELTSSDDDSPAGKGGMAGASAGSGGASAGTTAGKSGKAGSANGGSSSGSGGKSGGTGGKSTTGGTGNAAGGADDGGGGNGTSGTGTGGSAGTGGAPPDIPLNQMCEDFAPCGGDPEGSWTVTDTCLETAGDVMFLDAPGCEDSAEGVGAIVSGTRTYENGELTFEQTVTARVALLITDACAQGLLGTMDVDAAMLCPLLPALAGTGMMSPFQSITCAVEDDDACHCDAYYDGGTTMTTTTYTVDGTTITQGDGVTYDFCQDGDSLILHGMGDTTGTTMNVVDQLTVQFERD